MATSESGRGSRARGSGRARTSGAAGPAVRRTRTRYRRETRHDAADTGAVAVIDAPVETDVDDSVDEAPDTVAGIRLPAVFARVHSVFSRRVIAMVVVLILLAVTLAVPVQTYWNQRGEFRRLQAANEQLARDVEHYQRRVTEQNDPAYIEAAAREQLQYVMPGEKPLVLTYPSREQHEQAQEKAREYAANPWYQNLWDAVSTPPEDK